MNRAHLQFVLALVAVLVAPALARAQTFHFSNGRQASLAELRVQGDQVYLPLKNGDSSGGELGMPIASIVRMDWPAPDALARAADDLAAGRPADALKKLDTILPPHEPFRDVAGSWWASGAILRLEALARLGREIDAEVALERLRRARAASAVLDRGELALASALLDAGETKRARERLAKIDATTAASPVLARLALANARILQSEGKAEAALLGYLRVPVLHPAEKDLQAAALLGAAACYQVMGESARAATARQTLLERFPDSAEAAKAASDSAR